MNYCADWQNRAADLFGPQRPHKQHWCCVVIVSSRMHICIWKCKTVASAKRNCTMLLPGLGALHAKWCGRSYNKPPLAKASNWERIGDHDAEHKALTFAGGLCLVSHTGWMWTWDGCLLSTCFWAGGPSQGGKRQQFVLFGTDSIMATFLKLLKRNWIWKIRILMLGLLEPEGGIQLIGLKEAAWSQWRQFSDSLDWLWNDTA